MKENFRRKRTLTKNMEENSLIYAQNLSRSNSGNNSSIPSSRIPNKEMNKDQPKRRL